MGVNALKPGSSGMESDNKLLSHYQLIADLFDYPDQEYPEIHLCFPGWADC